MLVIEDSDTKEITVKIFVLDRMAGALDLSLLNKKDDGGDDLSNSNKLEIVALLKEMKFKNKEEWRKFVNDKRREKEK